MNNKVFISGRVTGDPSYPHKFEAAEDTVTDYRFFERHRSSARLLQLRARQPRESHFPQPSSLGLQLSVCMAVCLWHLAGCSHVYFLDDWRQSRGARIEHCTARLLGKHIIYQHKTTMP